MSASSHIQSVLIGTQCRICHRTVYLLFAIWVVQIQSKLIYIFLTYGLTSCKLRVCHLVLIQFAQAA